MYIYIYITIYYNIFIYHMHAINQGSLAKSASPGRLPAAAGRPAVAARGLGAALDDASRGGGVRPIPGAQARTKPWETQGKL